MPGWESPHSEPGTFGLEVLAEVDDPESCYSFNLVVVWRELATGRVWWGQDEGCSCPCPFEGESMGYGLQPLPESRSAFAAALGRHPAPAVEKVALMMAPAAAEAEFEARLED